jgi:ABC-2 type transport system ATP-binding protein
MKVFCNENGFRRSYLPENNMIKVEGLTKRYARHIAVDNISFEVEPGQIVGFLGPNGAGKTTTMRVLTCFLPPTGGGATVAGFDVVKEPMEVKKRVGYLPETPPLYPEMEVHEYLQFAGRLHGLSGPGLKARVEEVAGRCNVADVMTREIGKLSKGYRQRVGLAQAILHNPDVLILDEPTAGLDPKQILETRSLIKSLAGQHTIILSTHILPEVEQTCQKVIIINKGRLVASESVENLSKSVQGAEAVHVEVEPRGDAELSEAEVQPRLEMVAGVERVVFKESRDRRLVFDVQGMKGRSIRPEIARAVVESGWNLVELHAPLLSLEEIFLQLTAADQNQEGAGKAA